MGARPPSAAVHTAARSSHPTAQMLTAMTQVLRWSALATGLFYGAYTQLSISARERAQAALRAASLPSAIYYPKPLHHQPAYRAAHAGAMAGGPPPLPVSESLCERVLALPMHPYLTESQVARVAEAVLSAF